jgi:hypothetical protein
MIWKKGDIITEERYNNIKRCYTGLPKSILITCTITSEEEGNSYTLNKTEKELEDLAKSGYIVYFIMDGYIYYMTSFSSSSVTFVSKYSDWYRM